MNREEIIADEVFMIEDGGEMPEVAFNSSLYYLTRDPDGPQLSLSGQELLPLKEAAIRRYSFIVLRDLQPENRTKPIYRGLARSRVNWLRLLGYCQREQLSLETVQGEVVQNLIQFLTVEYHDVCVAGVTSCINCTKVELEEYAGSLGVDLDRVVKGWRKLFNA